MGRGRGRWWRCRRRRKLQHRPAGVERRHTIPQGAPHMESVVPEGPSAQELRRHPRLEVSEAALALRQRQIRRALREPVELRVEIHLPRGEVLPRRVARRRRAVDQGREDPRNGGVEPGICGVDAPRARVNRGTCKSSQIYKFVRARAPLSWKKILSGY